MEPGVATSERIFEAAGVAASIQTPSRAQYGPRRCFVLPRRRVVLEAPAGGEGGWMDVGFLREGRGDGE